MNDFFLFKKAIVSARFLKYKTLLFTFFQDGGDDLVTRPKYRALVGGLEIVCTIFHTEHAQYRILSLSHRKLGTTVKS